MDDYTLQQELEALAGNVYNPDLSEDKDAPEPISKTAARWQELFSIASMDETIETIMAHRNNLTRSRVSDAHWETVRADKEASGYDREAYEYEIELLKKKAGMSELVPEADGGGQGQGQWEGGSGGVSYLVEMSGPLDSVEKVQRAAGLEAAPEVVSGRSVEEGRAVRLCCVDAKARGALLKWAAEAGGRFEPTILVNPKSLR